MKPSELTEQDMKRLSFGKATLFKAVLNEILRQQRLGIDEDIENNINVEVKELNLRGD